MLKKKIKLNKTDEMALQFKKQFGRLAKKVDANPDCFRISINKNVTKTKIINFINKMCLANNLPLLNKKVASPFIKKGKYSVGISSVGLLTKNKPIKIISLFVYFKKQA